MKAAKKLQMEKRCPCDPEHWNDCPEHPWYLKLRVNGVAYEESITRWALAALGKRITLFTDAASIRNIMVGQMEAGTFIKAKNLVAQARATAVEAKVKPVVVTGLTLQALALPADPPLAEPIDFFTLEVEKDTKKRQNSKVNDRAILRRLCKRYGRLPMELLVLDHLNTFRESLTNRKGEPLAASSWNKYRTVLGQLFAWAAWKGHIPKDPIMSVPKQQRKLIKRVKPAQRIKRFPADIWDNLLEAALEQRADCRLYECLIGLEELDVRIGELLALQWGDIDLAGRTVWIRAKEVGGAKTGNGRRLTLSDFLYQLLTARHMQFDPAGQRFGRRAYAFGDPYGQRVKSIRKAYSVALLRAHNIEPRWKKKNRDFDTATRAKLADIDLKIHDIRHEAVNRKLESGQYDLEHIKDRLGHATLAQTSTYVHPVAGSIVAAQRAYDAQRAARGKQITLRRGKLRANGRAPKIQAVKAALLKRSNRSTA
jgi:integrase